MKRIIYCILLLISSTTLCQQDENKDALIKELERENKELRDENHKLTRDVRDFYRDATNLAKQLIQV